MRKEYDFSKGIKNPYVRKLKKQISIRIDPDTIDYFKKLADETGIRYQNLINSYLADCVARKMKPSMVWQKGA
jgi:uncharacterized protein (DUF4415 family)